MPLLEESMMRVRRRDESIRWPEVGGVPSRRGGGENPCAWFLVISVSLMDERIGMGRLPTPEGAMLHEHGRGVAALQELVQDRTAQRTTTDDDNFARLGDHERRGFSRSPSTAFWLLGQVRF